MRDHSITIGHRLSALGAGIVSTALALTLPFVSCRTPDTPIIKDQSRGIIYDTAMEKSLRSGKAPALLQTSYGPYVDTLAEPVAITAWTDQSCVWEIFVGTNRGLWDDSRGEPSANRVLAEAQFGRATVTIPRGPRDKSASTPTVPWRKKKPDNPVVAEVKSSRLPADEFLDGVCGQLERSRQKDLLVFVHGFNVSFDAALAGTAQLALNIPFNGAVVTYAWPSQGGVFNYREDEPINFDSVAPFTDFLQTLIQGVPEETRIAIVVHSMGNRIVMQGLGQLPPPVGRKPIAVVALCAPDVGHTDFEKWAPGVLRQAESVSLYSSANDSALIASKGLHAEKRAGDAWQPILYPGIEVVDCSRVDLTLMGHSYYGENGDVLSDLFMLIKEGRPADQRPHLEQREGIDGVTYWTFQSSAPAIYCTWHFEKDEPTRQ